MPQLLWVLLEHSYQSMYNNIRASPVACLNFYTVWTMNSDIYFLPTYFFKYTFQQILYHFSISFKYYFFIHSLLFFNLLFILPLFILNNYIFQQKVLHSQYFLQYFYKNHNKILYGKLLLVLIWTPHWNYFFTYQY